MALLLRTVGIGAYLWPVLLLVAAITWVPAVASMLASMAALFYVVRSIATLLPSLREQRKATVARAAIYITVAVASIWTFSIYQGIATGRAGELVSAIERHHQQTGRYPDSLDALVPRFAGSVPSASVAPFAQYPFVYRRRDESFELYYVAGFLVSRWYSPETGKWQVRD